MSGLDADTLQHHREMQGWSQKDLAVRLSNRLMRRYTAKDISRWERGERGIPPIPASTLASELGIGNLATTGSKILAIANQKGGVGKTTSAINLGFCLTLIGERVLVLDNDHQSNLTQAVGFVPWHLSDTPTIVDVYYEKCGITEAIYGTDRDGLEICPARPELAQTDVALMQQTGGFLRLRRALSGIGQRYDWVIVDCPPNVHVLFQAALAAADYVLLPTDMGPWSGAGIPLMIQEINQARKTHRELGHELRILGVLPTQYHQGRVQHEDSLANLHTLMAPYGIHVFDPVPRAEIFQQAASLAAIAAEIAPDEKAVQPYMRLAHKLREINARSMERFKGAAEGGR